MSPLRSSLHLLLVAASVAACRDVAGPRAGSNPSGTPFLSASVAQGTGVFATGGPLYLECLGETVNHWFSVPYSWHSVTTAGTGTIFTDHFLPGEATGAMWGLTSGTVWTPLRAISPETITTTAGSTYIFTSNLVWVSASGPTVHLHGRYQFVQNANGDIVVDKSGGNCVAR